MQQSVSAVQCTQKSDNIHAQVVPLPGCISSREVSVLPVDDSPPGCGRLASAVDRQLRMSDAPDNREAAAAVNDDEHNHNDVVGGSAIAHQRTGADTMTYARNPPSSAAVPPSSSTPGHQKHQQKQQQPSRRLAGLSHDEPSSSSHFPSPMNLSRRACQMQSSSCSAAVDFSNTPSSLRISNAGQSVVI